MILAGPTVSSRKSGIDQRAPFSPYLQLGCVVENVLFTTNEERSRSRTENQSLYGTMHIYVNLKERQLVHYVNL